MDAALTVFGAIKEDKNLASNVPFCLGLVSRFSNQNSQSDIVTETSLDRTRLWPRRSCSR